MIIIEQFHKRVREASAALIQLSSEFERLEIDHSDLLCDEYPFSVCLLEVVRNMLDWQESINNHLEAMKHETETASS